VAAESCLKYILLNRGFERLKHPEKCGETTEKSMEKCGKTPSKHLEKCGKHPSKHLEKCEISLKNIWKNVKKYRFDVVNFHIRLKTLGADVAKITTKITKFAS
jgi:hypothetical protein